MGFVLLPSLLREVCPFSKLQPRSIIDVAGSACGTTHAFRATYDSGTGSVPTPAPYAFTRS